MVTCFKRRVSGFMVVSQSCSGFTDRTDPYTATLAAGRYIQHLLEDFDGDERSVVMAYNMGGANLRKHGPTKAAKALAELVACAFRVDPLFLRSMD